MAHLATWWLSCGLLLVASLMKKECRRMWLDECGMGQRPVAGHLVKFMGS